MPKPPTRPLPPVEEGKIHGLAACQAVFRHRREAIVRAYFTEATAKRFGPLMRFLAEQRRAYHLVDEAELERVAESRHHGGVCLLVRLRPALSLSQFYKTLGHKPRVCVLALEGVGNPHNLGAILRTAAHFGVDAALVEDAAALQSGAAGRTAEGGLETLNLIQAPEFLPALKSLREAGFTLVATSSHGGRDLFDTQLPARCVILLGQEQEGLSSAAFEQASLTVRIPGSGAVESLNVSVAAGILLAEQARQAGARPEPPFRRQAGAARSDAPRRSRAGKPRRRS